MLKNTNFVRYIQIPAVIAFILILAAFITLVVFSYPSIKEFGFGFIIGEHWDPVMGEFGARSFLVGTILTSFLALIMSLPFSLLIAIFLGEYARESVMNTYVKTAIELLAGIPSIVYGFWGLFVLVPIIREYQIMFDIPPYGVGIFTSSVVLAIMIIPYTVSISQEVIKLTPTDLKEAAYSMGATKYEVLKKIILPFSSSGITAGILLSLGRALGETMAVTMVIGNSNMMPESIFDPGATMASLIANEFTEATDEVYLAALIEIGLLLFVVTAIINMIGRYTIKKLSLRV